VSETSPPLDETDLDALVRRVDPDRWLASRFIADKAKRAEVVALYALNFELARVGESVSNPLAGEIRLAWWRERLEAIAGGADAPGQPVLLALAEPPTWSPNPSPTTRPWPAILTAPRAR
jgi:phytoene synthase